MSFHCEQHSFLELSCNIFARNSKRVYLRPGDIYMFRSSQLGTLTALKAL